ncbi:UBP-type zinc finger domain-containing protein [Tessaracoccus antarcticus]|uniref:UBP-type domain-containing protein n=1 Tax=Tessaracoccus antarcticus TaxID=2479848 RepID=A0A3M0G9Y5_9ACTN|nr:UBP-type zinc finger domain-containing protein [Tessaracoccus antarcticus]RMB61760.1 hypothetical protein EAX62_03825 [Tessaracoccus antarcticus]
MTCTHLDNLTVAEPTTPDGCGECLQDGSTWVHLRLCMDCGHVGCCDSSPNKHATAHNIATGHSVIQSFEPGERWAYCYTDDEMLGDVGAELDRSY